jgi:hypothetical protein
MGSVAECRAEVENPDHCPEDFPEYPQCSDPKPSCKLAVVGAGAGGLYTAMRLVDEGVFEATDVCVFEATERVGGRIYSLRGFGPDSDLTVDAGAYRTWPNFTVSSLFLRMYLVRTFCNPLTHIVFPLSLGYICCSSFIAYHACSHYRGTRS